MDSSGQDYIVMHFMHWHVRTRHILLFIISQNSDSIKDERVTLIHFSCYFGGQLISDHKVLSGDPKQRKWRKQVSWCPDWNSYARGRHKPLSRAGTVPREGKGRELEARRGVVMERSV